MLKIGQKGWIGSPQIYDSKFSLPVAGLVNFHIKLPSVNYLRLHQDFFFELNLYTIKPKPATR